MGQSTLLNPVTTLVDKSKAGNKLPVIIDNSGNTRGAGFNNENIFVATRTGGNIIYYWEIAKPEAEPKTMNTTLVSGGTFPASDLTVVGKQVFMSNMVNATGAVFKIYEWSTKESSPRVLLEFPAPATNVRLGDAITVLGNPATEAQLIVSGWGTKNFYIWKIKGDEIPDKAPLVITLDSVTNVNFARITKVPQSDQYLASGPTMGMALLDKDFKVLDWIKPGVYFPSWPMYAHIIFFKGKRLLAYQHVKTSPIENFQYIMDISADSTTLAALRNIGKKTATERIIYSVNLGNVTNGNASVSMDLLPIDAGQFLSFNYSAGNGFLLQKFGDMASSVNEIDPNAFTMGPNPTSGLLQIDSKYVINQILISDLNARIIKRIPMNSKSGTIDLGNLENGVLLLSLETQTGVYTQKLLLQK
jgi:hypothetical protein